jgi:hypothetical protein
MNQMNAQAKYVAVNIPVPLMRRIEKLVTTQGGFMSATDYITYFLRVKCFLVVLKKMITSFFPVAIWRRLEPG